MQWSIGEYAVFHAAQAAAENSMVGEVPADPALAAALEAREERLFERAHEAGQAVLERPASSVADFADKLAVIVRQERGLADAERLVSEMRAVAAREARAA